MVNIIVKVLLFRCYVPSNLRHRRLRGCSFDMFYMLMMKVTTNLSVNRPGCRAVVMRGAWTFVGGADFFAKVMH